MGDLAKILDPGDFAGTQSEGELKDLAISTTEAQTEELRRQFDIGQERLAPTLAEAVPAFQLQAALSGAQGPEAQRIALQQQQETPGTEFAREEGLRFIESSAGAGGGLGGGERLRQLTRFGTELASRGLGEQFGRAGVVSGAGQGAGTQLVGLGSRFAGNIGQIQQQGAQNISQAIQGAQQQRSQAVGTGIGLAAAFASDKNIKEDIHSLSPEQCFDLVQKTELFAWRYMEECGIDTDVHFGPMAQDAPDIIKVEGKEALRLHDELWLIAGAMKHLMEVKNGERSTVNES